MPPDSAADQPVPMPPDPAQLLPETQPLLQAWQQRLADDPDRAGRLAPAFSYQDLPSSARLAYELVGWHNFAAYLPLFAADPSPFVDARFRHRAALESYAVHLLTELRCSRKRGAADWLVRRRTDGQLLGVLHLYDLNREVFSGRVPHCAVGYALGAPFRRQGYGQEALAQLLAQAAALFGRTEARSVVAADNLASEALLRRSGFAVLEDRPAARREPATRLWHRELSGLV